MASFTLVASRFLVAVVGILVLLVLASAQEPKVVWESISLDWNWPGGNEERESAIASGRFVQENCVVTGVKYYKGYYYLTVPRWLNGVPSTMNYWHSDDGGPNSNSNNPNLNAWPSFQMNAIDDCSALQYVQSMEIDSVGRMWIIDVGSTAIFEDDGAGRRNICPPKLVIIDVNSQEVLHRHTFSPEVASWNFNFLNDIVINQKEGFAYITDTLGFNNTGGLIVFSLAHNSARRFTDNSTEVEWAQFGNIFHINGRSYNLANPSDTIALDGDGKTLFYGALSGFNMFQIPTSYLHSFNSTKDEVTSHIKKGWRRPSQCDGMTSSSAPGVFFYGTHAGPDSLVRTTIASDGSATTVSLYSNNETMQWVDTLGWKDSDEVLLWSTNRLARFFLQNPPLSTNESNFRVFELSTPGYRSYLTNPTYQQPPIQVKQQQSECSTAINWKDPGRHSEWEKASVKGLVAVASIVAGGFFCILIYVACISQVTLSARMNSDSVPKLHDPVSSPIHNTL